MSDNESKFYSLRNDLRIKNEQIKRQRDIIQDQINFLIELELQRDAIDRELKNMVQEVRVQNKMRQI